MNSVHVVILAGGSGTRFWPLSRSNYPKQFLNLTSNQESLIQATARRAEKLVTPDKIWVVTNESQKELVREHLPNVNIIAEPVAKNTAASIGLAVKAIKDVDPDAIMVSLHSDHAIEKEDVLIETLKLAIDSACAGEFLVTIGIKPTFAHTGYGYVQRGANVNGQTYKVKRFYEKPSLDRAKQYLQSGEYFWNSGLFVWNVNSIWKAYEKFMPGHVSHISKLIWKGYGTPNAGFDQETLNQVFKDIESQAVEFGIIEHAQNCQVVVAQDFGWNDVGSWDAWADLYEKDSNGNLERGPAILINTKNCIVNTTGKLVALVGVDDMAVINTDDAVLVIHKDKAQDVKFVVEELKKMGRKDLL